MIKVPEQLEKIKLAYCKVAKQGKNPIEPEWQKNPKTLEEIKPWIEQGGNYGVLCGHEGLIVIDCDKPQLSETIQKKLPLTLTITTGSGGKHFYYKCLAIEKKIVLTTNAGIHYGEVQSHGTQVVGPGSIHPNGKEYTANSQDIIEITPTQLIEAIKTYMKSPQKEIKQKRNESNQINSLRITDIMDTTGFKTTGSEMYGSNPWHGSTGGANTWINTNKNVAHCFRCQAGITPAKAIGINEGIITSCSDTITKNQFKTIIGLAIEKYNLPTGIKKEDIKVNKDIEIFKKEVAQNLIIGQTDIATEQLTKHISDKYRFYTVKHNEQPDMWVYQDGIYINLGKHVIKEECRKILEVAYKPQLALKVISKIEADTGINEKDFFADSNIYDMPLQNGILNIRTRSLELFTPDKIFFNKLPVYYDQTATCPNIKNFLNEVLEHGEKDAELVFEHIGNHLLKDMRFEKSVMALGSGSNGKSILISLLRTFLGADNYSSIPLERLNSQDTTALAEMHGMLGNIVADLGKKALKDTGTFKTSTGGDAVSAKRKFKSDFKYNPYAKHTYSCNELPLVYDTSDGFWRRWAIINFPYSYYSKEDIRLDPSKKEGRLADKNILKTLTTKKEMSGLLNESLKGLNRLFDYGYSTSQSTKQVKEAWEKQSNNVPFFIRENLEEEWEFVETKAKMKAIYVNWCAKNKLKPISDRQFNTVFKEELDGVYECSARVVGVLTKCWKGVKIKSTVTTVTTVTTYSKSPYERDLSCTLEKDRTAVTAVTLQGMKKVVFLRNFGKCVGTDLGDYGPFVSGDEGDLPDDMADVFVKNGSVRLL